MAIKAIIDLYRKGKKPSPKVVHILRELDLIKDGNLTEKGKKVAEGFEQLLKEIDIDTLVLLTPGAIKLLLTLLDEYIMLKKYYIEFTKKNKLEELIKVNLIKEIVTIEGIHVLKLSEKGKRIAEKIKQIIDILQTHTNIC